MSKRALRKRKNKIDAHLPQDKINTGLPQGKEGLLDEEALESPFVASQLWRLLAYLRPYRWQMALAMGLLIITALSSLLQLRLLTSVIGVVQTMLEAAQLGEVPDPQLLSRTYMLVGGMLGLQIAAGISYYFRTRIMETAGRSAIAALRHDVFAHLQSLSLTYFDGRPAGKLLVRVVNDVNSLNDLFTNGIINMLVDCLTLIFVVIIMMATSVTLTLVSLCMLPLLVLMAFVIKRRMRQAWQAVRSRSAVVNAYLHESLAGVRVTQAFAREEENFRQYESLINAHRKTWMQAIKVNNIFWAATDFIGTAGTVLLYAVGVNLLQQNGPDMLETLLTMVWFLGRFWGPINNLSNFYNSIMVAMASTERIFEIMDTKPDIGGLPDAPAMPPIQGRVAFEKVGFAYEGGKTVLENVSFEVKPGQTVALVGPTGAGKSTVVNLISRFYDPQTGRVLVDGQDIKAVNLNSLRSQMGVMLQDSFIFSGSILDNIRYGKLDATREEAEAAARAVLAHDFIMEKEQGYDTEVNERGSALSVGQRQLISFARTLLADPRVLILDEATASIDTKTERVIQQALETLLRNRTSFVIAHRLSTIRKADVIMVISEGGVAEAGTHAQLMQIENGHYRGLCEAQYRFLEA